MYRLAVDKPGLYFPNIRVVMTDLYESDTAVAEVANYYRDKVYKWLKSGKYDQVLDYFSVSNGKVTFDKGETTDANRDLKAKYVKEKYLSHTGMVKLVERVKRKTGILAYDFTKNQSVIKHAIKSIFKTQLEKHM